MNRLKNFHLNHQGKVTDKWELYLDVYNELFGNIVNNPVRLLEIGVQNGGSLEIWSKYFENAKIIIGCDINRNCQNLKYNKDLIKIIIGDVTADKTLNEIRSIIDKLDIIIDDGSHVSSDVIKTFINYFPILADNGLYVIEDMHCSYWQEYAGGLHKPTSSIGFFKSLCDVINHEHWGLEITKNDYLISVAEEYKCNISESELSKIHSIKFKNSMCIIEKKESIRNTLNRELVTGKIEHVQVGRLLFNNKNIGRVDQSSNPWSINPKKIIDDKNNLLKNQKEEIKAIKDESSRQLRLKDEEIEAIKDESSRQLRLKDEEVRKIIYILNEYNNSISWKITKPLRQIKSALKTAISYSSKIHNKTRNYISGCLLIIKNYKQLLIELLFPCKDFFNLKRNEQITDTINQIGSIGVIYLFRNTCDNDVDSAERFIASYKKNFPFLNHNLHIVLKGQSLKNQQVDFINDLKCQIHHLPDDGFDIGAYIRIAHYVKDEVVIFLNTHSYICSDKWLEKLVNPFRDENVGLVGCTGSYESLSPISEEFPPHPNPHIRTNAFAVRREVFVDITKGVNIVTKHDALLFESGSESMTNQIKCMKLNVLVVDKNGFSYTIKDLQKAGTFRSIFRKQQLVSDNQHDIYSQKNIIDRILVTINTWGSSLNNDSKAIK